ncbi:aminoglycoside 6-adenylyltransferase [Lysinibacillus sp. NPDC094177]|uniref:aminoglycoside 6-adenylyltransferase n=1 Tax=Lysinibacillus sp. NPDC094177 TaxID=3390580 RepID=UPI003CFEB65A
MRTDNQMFNLKWARKDDRIRAVIMNGSRTNLNAPKDIFLDIVYVVTEIPSFIKDTSLRLTDD